MKKVLAIILAIAMIASFASLAACTVTKTETETTETVVSTTGKEVTPAIASTPQLKIYDVVTTYDDIMVIETEEGQEALLFDGMTEEEQYATSVLFINGDYACVVTTEGGER